MHVRLHDHVPAGASVARLVYYNPLKPNPDPDPNPGPDPNPNPNPNPAQERPDPARRWSRVGAYLRNHAGR